MLDTVEKIDGRRARSAWRETARRMKDEGKTLDEIAEAVGRSRDTVRHCTAGHKTCGRPFTGAEGFKSGNLYLVPARFTAEQMQWIRDEAEDRQISVSTFLRRFIDEAMER